MGNEKNEKKCLHCGETFVGAEDQKYCDTSCRVMAYRKRKDDPALVTHNVPVEDDEYSSIEDAIKYKNMSSVRTTVINKKAVEVMPDKMLRVVNSDNKFTMIPISEYNMMLDDWHKYFSNLVVVLEKRLGVWGFPHNDFQVLANAMTVKIKYNYDLHPEILGNSILHFTMVINGFLSYDEEKVMCISQNSRVTDVFCRIIKHALSQGYFQKLKL